MPKTIKKPFSIFLGQVYVTKNLQISRPACVARLCRTHPRQSQGASDKANR
ncbi:Uncharacterized protein ChrSV_1840 [Chromobacterium vaccinii]|nr:Uncharacterized protein ChrSW_1840 [Chromobacterium vaccinii]QND89298.1 Uncharacterized protein ChrSV_1840 [Chromobacterium vaccinii]